MMPSILNEAGEQFRRESDSMSVWSRILYKYGVPSAIAIFLVWVLATKLLSGIEHVQYDLHDHMFQSAFYQQAMCMNLAKLAGEPPSQCVLIMPQGDPQPNHRR